MSAMAWPRAWADGEHAGGWLAGGMVTRDADGDGEGDPVRVDPGRAGRFGPQGAQRLVDDEERVEFLADQLR